MIRAGLLSLALVAAPAHAGAAAADDDVRVVLKFVKASSSKGIVVKFDPTSCPVCTLEANPAFARENARETLVSLRVPRRRTLDLGFSIKPGGVRRVILESGDVAFSSHGARLTVALPPLIADAVTAGELSTHLVEPGMVLRFEHDDPARRAGYYADAPTVFIPRQAANVLEFAQREAIRRLGIGAHVEREALGTIEVMGFDTNYPHGHTDSPPHIHMHLRWPTYAGTQIAHYYIDDAGLLAYAEIGVQLLHVPEVVRERGQTYTTIDRFGRPAYSHTITKEGWLRIVAWNDRTCLIRPVGSGFQTGAIVACDGQEPVTIQVIDDMPTGVLKVRTGLIKEVFRYDRDTGTLLSTQAPPAVTASNYPATEVPPPSPD